MAKQKKTPAKKKDLGAKKPPKASKAAPAAKAARKASAKAKKADGKKREIPAVAKDLPFKVELGTKVSQRDVAWRLIDGEAVIITPGDNIMQTLNDTGTRIWELLNGTRSLRDVADMLAVEFEVDRKRAEQDTIWFVECLAKKGLVAGPHTLDDLDDDEEEEAEEFD
jgi:hypothetical protein